MINLILIPLRFKLGMSGIYIFLIKLVSANSTASCVPILNKQVNNPQSTMTSKLDLSSGTEFQNNGLKLLL